MKKIIWNRESLLELVRFLLLTIAGAALYAVSVNCFTAPNQIAPGGATGVATILKDVFGTPIGLMMHSVVCMGGVGVRFSFFWKNHYCHADLFRCNRSDSSVFAAVSRGYDAGGALWRSNFRRGAWADVYDRGHHRRQ